MNDQQQSRADALTAAAVMKEARERVYRDSDDDATGNVIWFAEWICDRLAASPVEQPAAAPTPCVHPDDPKACYRVRCQLGGKCVDDDMSPRQPAAAPIDGTRERIAKALHYPDCWDTAAYPTLDTAVLESLNSFLCSECMASLPAAAPIDEPSELEQVIACLGDDAATLRHADEYVEMADNMEAAARLLAAAVAEDLAADEMCNRWPWERVPAPSPADARVGLTYQQVVALAAKHQFDMTSFDYVDSNSLVDLVNDALRSIGQPEPRAEVTDKLIATAGLLAAAVIEYPEFDGDTEHDEPRPLRKIAEDVLAAIDAARTGASS